jgi:hypothetical protein
MNAAQLINQTSGATEYFTPSELIQAAYNCMGGIELDPASCAEANLVDWTDSHYRIDAWVGQGTFFAYYHFGTNYYNAYFTASSNACAYFDLTDKLYEPNQFFRLEPK